MMLHWSCLGLLLVAALPAGAAEQLETAQRVLQAIQHRPPLAARSQDDAATRSRIQIGVELENQLRALGQRSIPTAAPLTPAIPPVNEEALPRRLVM